MFFGSKYKYQKLCIIRSMVLGVDLVKGHVSKATHMIQEDRCVYVRTGSSNRLYLDDPNILIVLMI